MKRFIIATALAAVAMNATAWAQAPDPHHPAEGGTPPVLTQPVAPTPPGMAGMAGMADMMRMMQSMHTMMMGPDMAGMGTIDRVEGRIALLRAELKITDAQTSAWNTFADALRTNAQKLGALRPAMMPQAGSAAQTIPDRLEMQERWLTARVEGHTRNQGGVHVIVQHIL